MVRVAAAVGLIAAAACSASAGASSGVRDRAVAEDGSLLAKVPAVQGANPAASAPLRLLRQAPQQPSLQGLVTRARYWTVGRDWQTVYQELTGAVPAGLKNSVLGSSSGPSPQDDGQYAVEAPRSLPAGIAYAQLVLEVAPAGADSSAIGAYASAATQPARPAAEIVPSAVASVTVWVTSHQGKVTRRRTVRRAAPPATAVRPARGCAWLDIFGRPRPASVVMCSFPSPATAGNCPR